MFFPFLLLYSDIALLLMRGVVGVVFFSSGVTHARNPKKRGKQMGIGTGLAFTLGIIEIFASVLLVLGAYSQLSALVLASVMLGAMFFKIFVWNTGFYAKRGYGWHYDLLLFAALLVIATMGAGTYTLFS